METYAEYSFSPGVYRGFCRACGSIILWRSEAGSEEVGITTGNVDEKPLTGDNEGSEGPYQGRLGLGVGKALCEPVGGHLWFANAVREVTDEVRIGKESLEGFEGTVLA